MSGYWFQPSAKVPSKNGLSLFQFLGAGIKSQNLYQNFTDPNQWVVDRTGPNKLVWNCSSIQKGLIVRLKFGPNWSGPWSEILTRNSMVQSYPNFWSLIIFYQKLFFVERIGNRNQFGTKWAWTDLFENISAVRDRGDFWVMQFYLC